MKLAGTLAGTARAAGHKLKLAGVAAALALGLAAALPQAADAQAAAAPAAAAPAANPAAAAPAVPTTPVTPADANVPVAAPEAVASASAAAATPAVDPSNPRFQVAPGGYTPMKPTPGKGMPVDGGIGLQTQYSPTGDYARWMHDAFLIPIITVISLFVLALLLWVVVRFNKRANPVADKTSHNTLLEVAWTVIPIVILVLIAVPSVRLIAKQFTPAPAKALTIKAVGNQWFWTYQYPDNGGIEVISNMLTKEEAEKRGEPHQLAADFRMVVPAGEPIRLQVTAADVMHAFAVPSLWYKIDAVPGRINEKTLFVKEPGVYYGQCSELCGARHGYMPIVVEALPRPQYNAWVLSQSGGKLDGLPEAVPAAAPAPVAGAVPPAAPPGEGPAGSPGAASTATAGTAPAAAASAAATPAA